MLWRAQDFREVKQLNTYHFETNKTVSLTQVLNGSENVNMNIEGKGVPKAPGIILAATTEHLQKNKRSKPKQSGNVLGQMIKIKAQFTSKKLEK